MAKPALGEQKKGYLSFLRVHKFKMKKQLTLLGYSFNDGTLTLELMALGSHEIITAILSAAPRIVTPRYNIY